MEKEVYVVFEVVRLTGKKEKGSTIEVGERFVGLLSEKNNTVLFTDVNGQEWKLKVGQDWEQSKEKQCIIIERF
ncbi:hypothetical protein EG359_22420 (plasmid) [Chryseobacterium joostei]|uniref:DUF4926 domain-containing protein n=1 Tax=Chryseobacterium joostei TaxID=112234 RepID=A0A1N7KH66_9FLAO|nr:hypothetical protein [Chryseobacterium joostei]AZB02416.1 hypothetical protein EG359_22420 [Chryseobacterium joostei]SIS60879.1 hypothetical protein SAMN05421768_11232 [Chryseobacterium joostei]